MYRKSKSTTKLKFFLHISLKKKERKCTERKQRRKNPKGNRKFYVKVFFYLSALAFYYYYDNFSVLCLFFGPEKKNQSFVYFRLFDCENIGFIFHGNVKHFHFLFWQLVSSKHFLVDFISWWFFSHFSTLFCFEIKMFGWLLPLIKLWPLITDCNSNKKRFIF